MEAIGQHHAQDDLLAHTPAKSEPVPTPALDVM
jgi:hypothetical protein